MIMGRHTAALSPMQRIRRALAGVSAVSMALIVGTISTQGGTYALWNDSLPIGTGTITSGLPELVIEGFDGLDHEYTLLGLATSATVTVANEGNVPLHGFDATITVGDGLADLLNEVSIYFTAQNSSTPISITDWLADTTLAPQQSVTYTAHTSVLSGVLTGALTGNQVTAQVDVTAQAGTSWSVSDRDSFTQSVGVTVDPPAEDFNMTFALYGDRAHSMDVAWIAPPGLTHLDQFHLQINGIQLPDSSSFNWPHQTVSTQDVPPQYRPTSVDQTIALVFTVTLNTDPTVIAQGTIWVIGGDGGDFYFINVAPTAAAEAAEPAPAGAADEASAAHN
ncbi:MAG: hypothetical protein FWF16_03195 [Microbacteriaceae bacterium]|nr:hypothetical protein [Microbacteriaceae bacterium]